ncbi:hypothetical protein PR048_011092 [Dryococelus australis]|uniref:Uncharacterized protein n=1 Tax=Dryococelus australis TaxID=614101 RepID=A0ABQ9HKK7_9NEOP|nr:hypothetical protein PR048_011092 [Dryococelus australis]
MYTTHKGKVNEARSITAAMKTLRKLIEIYFLRTFGGLDLENYKLHLYVHVCLTKQPKPSIPGVANPKSTTTNKKQESGIPQQDIRGKKESEFKVPAEKSFPKYRSHYRRADNPQKQYLSSEPNLSKKYSLYNAKCKEMIHLQLKNGITMMFLIDTSI